MVGGAEAEGLRTTYPEIPLIPVGEGYKIPTAWLIEHVAEAKTRRLGDIGTWPNQPLVIVNYGQATAHDVLGFSSNITKEIEGKTGIVLEREANFIV